jgi:hypothetical protein
MVAGANSVIVCVIAARTAQFGFIPANLFCIALYFYNVWNWRSPRVPTAMIVNGDHEYNGEEAQVADKIAHWAEPVLPK